MKIHLRFRIVPGPALARFVDFLDGILWRFSRRYRRAEMRRRVQQAEQGGWFV